MEGRKGKRKDEGRPIQTAPKVEKSLCGNRELARPCLKRGGRMADEEQGHTENLERQAEVNAAVNKGRAKRRRSSKKLKMSDELKRLNKIGSGGVAESQPLKFDGLPDELYLKIFEQLSSCSNVPVRWKAQFPHGHYQYDLGDPFCNFDRRSRRITRQVFEQNRFVRVSVQGGEVFQPSFHVPILTNGDTKIARYVTSGHVVASIHIGVPTVPSCHDQSERCLMTFRMLRQFLSRLSALLDACLPRDILVKPELLNDEPRPLQYDVVVDILRHRNSSSQVTYVSELTTAITDLQGDHVRTWTNPTDLPDLATRPVERHLGSWLRRAIEHQRSWIECSAKVAAKRMREAVEPEHPLAYTSPAIASASQSLFWTAFLSSWASIEDSFRCGLVRNVVAAAFNAMAIARGHGDGRDGWRNALRGNCNRPLCLCAIMSSMKASADGGNVEQTPLMPSEWPVLQWVGLSPWLVMCHVAALAHVLPEDLASSDDVSRVRLCVRELAALRQFYRRAGLSGDPYIVHDAAVLASLVAEIESWRAEHPEEDLSGFRPIPRAGEETDFVDTIDILWRRLSAGGRVEGLPLRVMHVDNDGVWIQRSVENGGEEVWDEDFIYSKVSR